MSFSKRDRAMSFSKRDRAMSFSKRDRAMAFSKRDDLVVLQMEIAPVGQFGRVQPRDGLIPS